MDYKYRIYHDYEVSSKNIEGLMHPFDKDREVHEYSCFPSTLAMLFCEPKIEASCEILTDEIGVLVTLKTELLENDAKTALASVLIKQNKSIKGLCLIGVPYS